MPELTTPGINSPTGFVLPDGTRIEWTHSSFCAGPDATDGQRFGRTYFYFRVNGGEWLRPQVLRSWFTMLSWCEICETEADFWEGEKS